jgi:membrane protein
MTPPQPTPLARIFGTLVPLPFPTLRSRLAEHHASSAAKAVAFDFFLALVPMVALIAWALARILNANAIALEHSTIWLELTPHDARELVDGHIRSFSESGMAPFAALGAWWLASSAFHTLIRLFEETFESHKRSYVSVRLLALGFSAFGIALFPMGAWVSLLLQLESESPIAVLLAPLVRIGLERWLLLGGFIAISTAYFSVLYRYALRRPFVRRRVCVKGGLVASLMGTIASAGLGYYFAHLAKFTHIYGSLLAVIVLALWLLIWSHALIIGAVVNVTLEDQGRTEPSRPYPSDADSDAPTQTPSPGAKSAGA